jgi:5'-phosphate synthase pdxT subunit
MHLKIGILALQGGVIEHAAALKKAASSLGLDCETVEVRTKGHLANLDGLIIPGGESTVLQKLCERECMFDDIKLIRNIFGTCAGAIMLAKEVRNKEADQRTLELMDIGIDRNAYGRQVDSFECDLETGLGRVHAVFIRAPKIYLVGDGVSALAFAGNEIVACEQESGGKYYLATAFHPELTASVFHERFLSRAAGLS